MGMECSKFCILDSLGSKFYFRTGCLLFSCYRCCYDALWYPILLLLLLHTFCASRNHFFTISILSVRNFFIEPDYFILYLISHSRDIVNMTSASYAGRRWLTLHRHDSKENTNTASSNSGCASAPTRSTTHPAHTSKMPINAQ